MRLKVKGVNIKTALIRQGYTFRTFSKESGISLSYFSAIMNSHYNPSPTMAKKICDALDIEFDEAFEIIEDEEANSNVSSR